MSLQATGTGTEGSGVPAIPEESSAYEAGGVKLHRKSSFLKEFGGGGGGGGSGEGGGDKAGGDEDGEGYWGRQIDPASGMAYYLNEKVTLVSLLANGRRCPLLTCSRGNGGAGRGREGKGERAPSLACAIFREIRVEQKGIQ